MSKTARSALSDSNAGTASSHRVSAPSKPLLFAEVLVHRLEHLVVQLEVDAHDGPEQLSRVELELPDQAVALDPHRLLGELGERRGVEDAAMHDADRAGCAKSRSRVGEPHRPAVGTGLT